MGVIDLQVPGDRNGQSPLLSCLHMHVRKPKHRPSILTASRHRICACVILVLTSACLARPKGQPAKPQRVRGEVINGDCYLGFVPDPPENADGGQGDADVSDAMAAGALDKDDILQRVKSHVHEVKQCYEDALKQDLDLSGREVFRWTIGPRGSVLSSRLISSEMNAPEVATCIGRHICDWRFPEPWFGGNVVITYPFVFNPYRPAAPAALPVNHTLFKGYRSPHMLVHSDAHQDAVHEVTQRLEELYAAITSTILAAKDDFPLELILFASERDFHKLSPNSLQGIFIQVRNRGVMMMFYREGSNEWGPAGLRSDYVQVAVHEMAHRLLDDVMPHAPSWFHEGLASFLETAFIREGHVWYGLPSASIMAALQKGPILPLPDLLSTTVDKHSWTKARYYATAWLLLNYFMVGNGGREVSRYRHLWQRLQEKPERSNWADVLIDVFDGKPLAVIEAELQNYADVMIVGRSRAARLRQMPITAVGEVPVREREADPEFVEEACRVLQANQGVH